MLALSVAIAAAVACVAAALAAISPFTFSCVASPKFGGSFLFLGLELFDRSQIEVGVVSWSDVFFKSAVSHMQLCMYTYT